MKLFPVTPDHKKMYREYIDSHKDKYPLAYDCWLARYFILAGHAIPIKAEFSRMERSMIFYYDVKELP